jgi:hypothetical protein
MDPGLFCGCGEFLRLLKIAAQRPFTVNVFTGIKSGQEDLPVIRDLDADGYDVDLAAAYQRERIVMPMLRAERLSRGSGAFSLRVATDVSLIQDNF